MQILIVKNIYLIILEINGIQLRLNLKNIKSIEKQMNEDVEYILKNISNRI